MVRPRKAAPSEIFGSSKRVHDFVLSRLDRLDEKKRVELIKDMDSVTKYLQGDGPYGDSSSGSLPKKDWGAVANKIESMLASGDKGIVEFLQKEIQGGGYLTQIAIMAQADEQLAKMPPQTLVQLWLATVRSTGAVTDRNPPESISDYKPKLKIKMADDGEMTIGDVRDDEPKQE